MCICGCLWMGECSIKGCIFTVSACSARWMFECTLIIYNYDAACVCICEYVRVLECMHVRVHMYCVYGYGCIHELWTGGGLYVRVSFSECFDNLSV